MRNFTKQYINGEWVDSASGETIDVINPATEEVMGSVAKGNADDVNKAVEAADSVYVQFRHSSVEERRDLLDRIVKEYENRKKISLKQLLMNLVHHYPFLKMYITKWD